MLLEYEIANCTLVLLLVPLNDGFVCLFPCWSVFFFSNSFDLFICHHCRRPSYLVTLSDQRLTPSSSYPRPLKATMPGALTKLYCNPSPTHTSPQKTSSSRFYPTPASMSPNTTSSSSTLNYPPSFDPHHTSSRYPLATHFAPYSPYRPGEYGRSERGLASERTRIERKLFADGQEEDGEARKARGSSPLAPAFEAKMVLRNGASIDLISW